MKKFIIFVSIIAVLQCATSNKSTHKHLWRFNDPYINQTIINAWENIQKQRFEWAAIDFTRLIQKGYIDYDILFGAGLAYYFMDNDSKALDYFTQAIEYNSYHFEAYYFRAQVFLKRGIKEKARQDLLTIINIEYHEPLMCGYYFDNNDVANEKVLEIRKKEVQKILLAIAHD